ncbi:deoxyribodipyrimidine photo-lyase [Hypericibacter adhaerens]|jgi:deoxyribodipyrimidine photo-lyase|uniref:Deoxyribodipyrimidine photo-lyase n=1 Tax=Hypericibacter adhaerens TaxID=2602016 RepID=A0A5J6MW04_9PROT|nr:deoxyribodipyrimidine photo-lyase [Hypericibacter adhaerens]QEX21629.1 deoxyribodipyrimidine photo-lyase [Hypericibacter adhaerens]
MPAPVILWFRQDLRLEDNPALRAASAEGPLIALYILDETKGVRPWGGASRWWLAESLASLETALRRKAVPLILRRGPADKVLAEVIAETKARSVHWNRSYEPYAIRRDKAIKAYLTRRGIAAASHNAALLFEPWTVETQAGEPFKVFTPFWRFLQSQPDPAPPSPAPRRLEKAYKQPRSEKLADWSLKPTAPDWAAGFRKLWQPGESGARLRLEEFLTGHLGRYPERRDRPDLPATARLSPHLHWGEIGPRQIWHAVKTMQIASGDLVSPRAAETFLRELGWREFSHHLLFHWPKLWAEAWRPEYRRFPWRGDPAGLAAWQHGRTGYPIVDAGMRELWTTGWMHNRVRMIAASFLVKHLLVSWQEGEAWFWDTLIDADLAQNAASWQWVAGSGADAAPYFRIFNPVLQGERFDPEGAYVRRWVPELARVPHEFLHKPWTAAPTLLAASGVVLGRDYPHPIVDHAAARARALAAFERVKK